jgi:1,4-dihydroxy-2-naphthoate polyprenyltransferase
VGRGGGGGGVGGWGGGPRRAGAAAPATPGQMRLAAGLAFGVAGAGGVALAAVTTWWLLAVGAVAFLAAVGYSGGRPPYGSAARGEGFVFIFFGLVATVGSAYVQDEAIVPAAVAAAVPVGLLASAILAANNLRDLHTDRAAGKRTLAVRLGDDRARLLYVGLVAAALALLTVVALVAASPSPLLGMLAAPLAVPAVRTVRAGLVGPDLVPVLVATSLLHLVFGLLLGLGLWLA